MRTNENAFNFYLPLRGRITAVAAAVAAAAAATAAAAAAAAAASVICLRSQICETWFTRHM